MKKETDLDEELYRVNKKIKKHSKALDLPVNHKTEILIKKELGIIENILRGDVMPKIHAAIYTMALGILTYLLGYPKMFFVHAAYAAALVYVTEFFHKRGDLTVKVFYTGLMIIPLYLIYLYSNDLLSLVMTVIFMISFVVTIALYFHHSKKEHTRELHHSFTRTFLAEWYAHVVSLAIAVALLYYIPNIILMDKFYSLLYIIIFWIPVPTLAYFFMNKFLYLRFFEPIHIRKDAVEGLKHALAYTVILIACLTLGYLLTAIQITIQEKDASLQKIDTAILKIETAKARLADLPKMKVTTEVAEELNLLKQTLENKKATITENFGVGDYFSDRYFSVLLEKRQALNYAILNKDNAIETVADLERNQGKVGNRTFVEQNYRPAQESKDLEEYRLHLKKSMNHYSMLMFDNSLFAFVHSYSDTGMQIFAPGFSKLSKKTYYITSHLRIFRDMLLYSFDNIIYTAQNIENPQILNEMYRNRQTIESRQSKDLRYAVLGDNII